VILNLGFLVLLEPHERNRNEKEKDRMKRESLHGRKEVYFYTTQKDSTVLYNGWDTQRRHEGENRSIGGERTERMERRRGAERSLERADRCRSAGGRRL